MNELQFLTLINSLIVVINLAILASTMKLYTEYSKDRFQESRKVRDDRY